MTDSSAPPNSASRKNPNANIARGIEELDAVGALAISKRNSRIPPEPVPRKTSPSTATLSANSSSSSSASSPSGAGGKEVNGSSRPSQGPVQQSFPSLTSPPGQSSTGSRPRSSARPRPSARPPAEHSTWPQWLFATAVLGAALWYLFSTEPPRAAERPHQVERRALSPGK